jgi:hypothetical protein
MPPRSLKFDGAKRELTPEQYDAFVQLSGQPAKQYLTGFIKTREWRAMDADGKREFVRETLREFRAGARETLRERFPDLGTKGEGGLPPLPPGFVIPPLPAGFEMVR